MHRRFLPSSAALLVALLLAIVVPARPAAALPQPPARDQAPPAAEAAGTGRLTVSVAAADSGAPLRRVRVLLDGFVPTLSSAPPAPGAVATLTSTISVSPGGAVTQVGGSSRERVHREEETDDNGRVVFTDLPGAMYSVIVPLPPAAFVRVNSSQMISLREGGSESCVIRLERGGAIVGHVFDDGGEPVVRASVMAYSRQPGSSGQWMAPGPPATTDDRGQFRLFGLPSGEYYVVASYANYSSPASLGGSSAPAAPRRGYIPTYCPNAPSAQTARSIAVRAGQDTAGADISLLVGTLGRIVLAMTDSRGEAVRARGGFASLSAKRADAPLFGSYASTWTAEGLVFNNVPAGDYYVVANITRGEGPNSEREGAYVPVSVNGGEVSVSLATNTGATLSGRVTLEGALTSPPPVLGSRASAVPGDGLRPFISLRPAMSAPSALMASGRPTRVAEDGTFRLTGVRGHVLLQVGAAGAALKAIRRGADDLTMTPLELRGTENIDDVEIVLTYDTGNIVARVVDDGGRPVSSAWIVAFPDDPKKWSGGTAFTRIAGGMRPAPPPAAPGGTGGAPAPGAVPGMARPGEAPRSPQQSAAGFLQPGQFVLARMLPGRYYLAVLPAGPGNAAPMPQYDPETLSSLRANATTVTVAVGETATVTLRASK